jgi:hypothetical protein
MPLITRQDKGDKLTIQEMDGNLTYLEQYSINLSEEIGVVDETVGNLSGEVAGLIGYPYSVIALTDSDYKFGNYSLTYGDLGKLLLSGNQEANVTITIPTSIEFIEGDTITIIRTGAGKVQIITGEGGTIFSSGNKRFIANTYESVKIICTRSEFFLLGDLSIS